MLARYKTSSCDRAVGKNIINSSAQGCGDSHMCWFSTTTLWPTSNVLQGHAYDCDAKYTSAEPDLKIAVVRHVFSLGCVACSICPHKLTHPFRRIFKEHRSLSVLSFFMCYKNSWLRKMRYRVHCTSCWLKKTTLKTC